MLFPDHNIFILLFDCLVQLCVSLHVSEPELFDLFSYDPSELNWRDSCCSMSSAPSLLDSGSLLVELPFLDLF